jgi:acyl-coenzyme A thioesterase 13
MAHSLEGKFDASTITGSISDDIKRAIGASVDLMTVNQFVPPESMVFGESIQKRLKVVEISVKEKADEPKKKEARVVVEVDATEGQHMSLLHNFY